MLEMTTGRVGPRDGCEPARSVSDVARVRQGDGRTTGGAIVATTSVSGFLTDRLMSHYSVSKAGLAALVEGRGPRARAVRDTSERRRAGYDGHADVLPRPSGSPGTAHALRERRRSDASERRTKSPMSSSRSAGCAG